MEVGSFAAARTRARFEVKLFHKFPGCRLSTRIALASQRFSESISALLGLPNRRATVDGKLLHRITHQTSAWSYVESSVESSPSLDNRRAPPRGGCVSKVTVASRDGGLMGAGLKVPHTAIGRFVHWCLPLKSRSPPPRLRCFVITPTTTSPPPTTTPRCVGYYFQQHLRHQPSLELHLHQSASPDSSPEPFVHRNPTYSQSLLPS